MTIIDLLRPECIESGLSLAGKSEVLEKVVEVAKRCSALDGIDVKTLLQGLQQREDLGSTGFGKGIAMPHCRLSGAKEFVIGLLSVPQGVEYGSLDGSDVKLIVFIIGPEDAANENISVLSEISHTLRTPGAIDEMVSASSSEVLSESFLRYCRGEVDNKDHNSKNLIHIHVTNEDFFHELLQMLVAMEPATLSVIEAKQASEYLAKMFMFAGFWSDREIHTCRIIIANIEKRLTNEVIRRIEEIVGPMDQSSEVSILVQDIFYSAGFLNATK